MSNTVVQKVIFNLKEKGFQHISFYDAQDDFTYFDAFMNGTKVEVRIGEVENDIEWRFLGIPIEKIEWFHIGNMNEEAISGETEEQEVMFAYETDERLIS